MIKEGDRSYERELEIVNAVRQAKMYGATWQVIGDAMGVSRQYAHKRFYPQIQDTQTN